MEQLIDELYDDDAEGFNANPVINITNSKIDLKPDNPKEINKRVGLPLDTSIRTSMNKTIIEKDESAEKIRETLVLIPNRYRTFQEQADYWLSRMENTEFSVDDLPEKTKK
jgi:hypothetical protein